MCRLFRRKVGRTLPLYGDRPAFDKLVLEHGESVVLDAFTEWLNANTDSLKKNKRGGLKFFLEQSNHWIQDQLDKRQEEEIEKVEP